MSMEINGKYGQYPIDYARRLEAGMEKKKETEKGQNGEKTSDKLFDIHDEYLSSEKSGAKPNGLYCLGQTPKVNSDNPEKPAEKCTVNTDAVDREIEELKEKKKRLEKQIQSASGDENKIRELKKELEQVECELSRKDNDTYRRQNASVFE